MRQAVDQVEIDAGDTGVSKMRHGIGCLPFALDTVDRLLDDRVEALYAEAGASNAPLAKRLRHGCGQASGIDFDSHACLLTKQVAFAQ
ncbi:hypothetical protein D3C86_1962520 [compost metagenome]